MSAKYTRKKYITGKREAEIKLIPADVYPDGVEKSKIKTDMIINKKNRTGKNHNFPDNCAPTLVYA